MVLSKEERKFIIDNESIEIVNLALKISKSNFDKSRHSLILNQIVGRQLSKKKIPKWYNKDIIYPSHISIEQSSSEETAKYKASLIKEQYNSFIDLTGGLGVDFSFLSERFNNSTYVEQNLDLCQIAEYNFKALKLINVSVINCKSEDYLKYISEVDIIYLDPARRSSSGSKVFRIEDCTPNITDIQELLLKKSSKTIIKYSPMLDISLAIKELKNVSEVHVVSVNNECKELLFVMSKSNKQVIYKTVNIKKSNQKEEFSFTLEDEIETNIIYTDDIQRYIYEPNASILKAGAFKSIAKYYNLNKLHPNSHLYTYCRLIENFPGRVFEVIEYFSPNKSNLKEFLDKNKKANIAVRNYPISVSEIRKRTKLKDGGNIYIFASTIKSGNKVWIVCSKV